jgi:folate-binding Fe-S cluster repair protein YgfZ
MQHRGTARRRPVIVSGVDVVAGTPVMASGRDSGAIGTPVDGTAVAIVRLDRFDGGEVTVDGRPVTIALPLWATYRLGESAAAE